MVRLARNKKQTHRLNSRLQMGLSGLTLAMTLTLNFQGQISNWIYLSKTWCDCHETKSKHIDWSQDLRCDHQVWPWPWPWPWIFKVKYGIGYISAKNGPIATKWKANTWIELYASNVTIRFDLGLDFDLEFSRSNTKLSTKSGPIATRRKANISIWTLGLKFDNGFDLGHDLDIWIFKVICDLDHLVTKVRCEDLPDSDRGDFSCRRAVDSSSLLYGPCMIVPHKWTKICWLATAN